ncbi:MAG TPA: TetR/AcrR family transcriptional regulator [Rhizomicrobium sp.]|nr:TetR/AcrR family transcriptional regulator [Rhizomicrobium sp.]
MKRPRKISDDDARGRILDAAFCAFMEHGYAKASTLEIATRAKVSKRELYSHFENKQALFAAGIARRTHAMQLPLEHPDVNSLDGLAATLKSLGRAILAGVTDDNVLAVHRLAITECEISRDVADTLDRSGRGQIRKALTGLLERAQALGLVSRGEPGEMAEQFCSVLFSDLLLRLMMGVARRPTVKEIARRADIATDLLLRLYAVAPAGQKRASN